MGEIVISSRIRLARNVAGYPFLARCSDAQRRELVDLLREKVLDLPMGSEVLYVDVETASELDRQLLVERHLISRHHADAKGARGVAVSGN
jgi:protein arginine kinase